MRIVMGPFGAVASLTLAFLLVVAEASQDVPAHFVDVTAASGLNFEHRNSATGNKYLI